MNLTHCVKVTIHGRVQGVGYRRWTVAEATARGLTGWVHNCADGTVEALFCGEAATIDAMLTACRRGPLMARVSRIELTNAEAEPFVDFTQR